MTWTYGGDPSANNTDAVRFLVGDTNTSDQLVTDGEISYALAEEGGVIRAAVAICRAIAAKFSRQADKTVGKLSISMSQKAKAYNDLADRLQQKSSVLVTPYAGGLSVSEKETVAGDSDAMQPIFLRGMMNCGG